MLSFSFFLLRFLENEVAYGNMIKFTYTKIMLILQII